MGSSCELKHGLCNCRIRTTVNIALCHYFFYGIFASSFVYSNYYYPQLYYVDHMFGGSGATLIGVTFIGSFFAHSDFCQPIRFILGILILLNVLLVAVSSYYYAVERWDDVAVTAFVRALRHPIKKDFPDYLWFALVVISCINCTLFLIYLPYVVSFMCHKWKSYMFASNSWVLESPVFSPFYIPSVPPSNTNAVPNRR